MCIYMHSHALTHDVRPQIQHPFPDPSDPSASPTTIVNPYSEPTPCRCQADPAISNWLQCRWHHCCRVVKRLVRCSLSSPCENPVDFHRYEPRPLRAALTESAEEGEGWHPLPVVDSAIWHAELVVETHGGVVEREPAPGAVRPAPEMARRALYVGLAAAVAGALAQLRFLADRTRDINLADHSICARVLNDGECPDLRAHYRAIAEFQTLREAVMALLGWALDCEGQMPWAGCDAKVAGLGRMVELDEWAADGIGKAEHGDVVQGCVSEWTQRVETNWSGL